MKVALIVTGWILVLAVIGASWAYSAHKKNKEREFQALVSKVTNELAAKEAANKSQQISEDMIRRLAQIEIDAEYGLMSNLRSKGLLSKDEERRIEEKIRYAEERRDREIANLRLQNR